MYKCKSSTITIDFEFKDRSAENIDQINRILAVMDLTDLFIEDPKGYMATTKTYKDDVVISTDYRYGLDSGTLICTKTDDSHSRRYQITTEVLAGVGWMKGRKFEDHWKKKYPERVLSSLVIIGFDELTAFIMT